MPNLVALGFMVSDQEIFKDFNSFSFVAMANRVLAGIKFFQEIPNRTMAGTFLRNLIEIGLVVSEKMFKIKVNNRTDGHARRTPGHDMSLLAYDQ